MTIAAGVLCKDGMVLCADTEETIAEGRKAQASKLRVWEAAYPKDDDCNSPMDIRISIGLAGAGHSDWIAAFIQGIDYALIDVPDDFNIAKFERCITDYTEQFFLKYIRAYAENPDHRPQVQMLILAMFPDARAIYRIQENVVLRTVDENFFWAVGAGAPVFENLMKLLLGKCHAHSIHWAMKEIIPVIAYIMDKVKSEVPGCGGNSHIVKIGKGWNHQDVPMREIREMEMRHVGIESEMYGMFAERLVKQAKKVGAS